MRRHVIIGAFILSAGLVSAQSVSYLHDNSKMNQITVAEIGSGSLTPSLYYDALHKNYSKSASQKNKLGLRSLAGIASYQQVDEAEKVDSAMTQRARIEALNVADRTGGVADVAWIAEGEKIQKKLDEFRTNINRIIRFGGRPDQQKPWEEKLKMFETAISATREAYMPNSNRKRQYLSIYADIARNNQTLVKYLVYLKGGRRTSELLNATYEKGSPNAQAAADALMRWRDAGWQTTNNSVQQ